MYRMRLLDGSPCPFNIRLHGFATGNKALPMEGLSTTHRTSERGLIP